MDEKIKPSPNTMACLFIFLSVASIYLFAFIVWRDQKAFRMMETCRNQSNAALDMLYPFAHPKGEPDYSLIKSKMARLRPWAESLQDPCWRWSYLRWIDYYTKDANEHLATQAIQSQAPVPEER